MYLIIPKRGNKKKYTCIYSINAVALKIPVGGASTPAAETNGACTVDKTSLTARDFWFDPFSQTCVVQPSTNQRQVTLLGF